METSKILKFRIDEDPEWEFRIDNDIVWHIGSKDSHPNARFALSDLEDNVSSALIAVKREKSILSLPPKNPLIDITVKAPSSCKRKTSEATNRNLENLGVEELLQKLLCFSQAVSVCVKLVSNFHLFLLTPYLFQVFANVSQSMIDLRIRTKEVERVLKERKREWKVKITLGGLSHWSRKRPRRRRSTSCKLRRWFLMQRQVRRWLSGRPRSGWMRILIIQDPGT